MTRNSFLNILATAALSLPVISMAQDKAAPAPAAAAKAISPSKTDTHCYEMRTYFAAPGKLPDLEKRFREHTVALFDKHGISNVIYLTPVDNKDNKLVYFVRFADRKARDAAFKEFGKDPEWQKAQKESEAAGRLVTKVDSQFFNATDFSPEIVLPDAADAKRTFELRTYTASGQNLAALHARFRDHTIKLFSKHGMKHYGYWEMELDQKGHDNNLVYLLSHDSKEACTASFNAFRADPEWIATKEASEKAAGGSLTIAGPEGVKSELFTLADFSPKAKK